MEDVFEPVLSGLEVPSAFDAVRVTPVSWMNPCFYQIYTESMAVRVFLLCKHCLVSGCAAAKCIVDERTGIVSVYLLLEMLAGILQARPSRRSERKDGGKEQEKEKESKMDKKGT